MACRLPPPVPVPLNSCHSASSEAACDGDAAATPASISTTRRRVDRRKFSLLTCHAARRRVASKLPHKSAAKSDIYRLHCAKNRDTCNRAARGSDRERAAPWAGVSGLGGAGGRGG